PRVGRAVARPPSARVGPVTPDERKAVIAKSPVKGKYDQSVDSESAYEVLQKRAHGEAAPVGTTGNGGQAEASAGGGVLGGIGGVLRGGVGLRPGGGRRPSATPAGPRGGAGPGGQRAGGPDAAGLRRQGRGQSGRPD